MIDVNRIEHFERYSNGLILSFDEKIKNMTITRKAHAKFWEYAIELIKDVSQTFGDKILYVNIMPYNDDSKYIEFIVDDPYTLIDEFRLKYSGAFVSGKTISITYKLQMTDE